MVDNIVSKTVGRRHINNLILHQSSFTVL